MSNICQAVLSGNLTADPLVKHEKEGAPNVVELRLATNRNRKDPNGDGYIEETSYFDLTVFGGFAALVDKKLRVGDSITAKCRPEQQRWETEDGSKRSKVVFIVEDIDAQAFFKKAEEVEAKKDGQPAPSQSTGAAASQSKAPTDDIPF